MYLKEKWTVNYDTTVETRIKEPKFLGDSVLRILFVAFTIHILGIEGE